MLFVHRSNRAENLVRALGDVISSPLSDPFEPESVIVQGRGMERWLSMQLAERFGVWANPRFPFPRHFLLDLLSHNTPIGEKDDAEGLWRFEPESLAWTIGTQLPELLSRPDFGVLHHYLAADGSPSTERRTNRLLQLSSRIARTFDDYVVFRPEMVAAWERGAKDGWQSTLWRRIVASIGIHHISAQIQRFLHRIGGEDVSFLKLPKRVSLFGVSTLAPLYLRIFVRLAEYCDVHLYVLSPSDHYWAELRDRRTVLREVSARADVEEGEVRALLEEEVGNRLLASLGRIGREFQAILESSADYMEEDDYEEPLGRGQGSALCRIQSDMMHLRYGAVAPPEVGDDDSIVVASCHSAMREVEVLHDHLLGLFAGDATLRPRDVIVMTPEIDTYAPFVEAVFDSGQAVTAIPYRIADRSPSASNGVFEAFGEILGVLQSRMTSAEVVDLLRLDVIGDHFGFGKGDLEVVREWVDRTEIRWGVDAAHRAEYGHPEVDQNTWAFGLRRMFLGYATAGERADALPYDPYDDIDGNEAALLGRLAEFCDRLFSTARRMRHERPMNEWKTGLSAVLDVFFSQDAAVAFEVQSVRNAVEAVCERAEHAGYSGPVDLPSIEELVEGELRTNAVAHGFLSGGVTFCELVPMRSIPFRVVCLIGMSDGTFPRVERRPDFDRLVQNRRWGDRSRREDDRYMFLEALLSARECFYVSYLGQNVQTNETVPPSVVVQELLDTMDEANGDSVGCEESTRGEDGGRVVRHRLQSFSPEYFRTDRAAHQLSSYSRDAYDSAQALIGERRNRRAFLSSELMPPAVEEVISLDDFVRFFEKPTRAFLQRRLGLYLGSDVEILQTREPVDLDDLERWKIGDVILQRLARGECCDLSSLSRLGSLPLGAIGTAAYSDIVSVARKISGIRDEGAVDTIMVDYAAGGARITGRVSLNQVGEHVMRQYSKIGGRKELSHWLRHLLLNCVADRPVVSKLYGRKGAHSAAVVRFHPEPEAAGMVDRMIELYRTGLKRPLLLFPEASRAYADSIGKAKSAAASFRSAEKAYEKGDAGDAYVAQVYGASFPASADSDAQREFIETAQSVFARFLMARDEVPL